MRKKDEGDAAAQRVEGRQRAAVEEPRGLRLRAGVGSSQLSQLRSRKLGHEPHRAKHTCLSGANEAGRAGLTRTRYSSQRPRISFKAFARRTPDGI